MEGVVEAVETSGKNLTLKLAVRDGGIAATTIKRAGLDYASLIDARVRIHGIGGSLFNKHSQIIGANLFFPGLETVSIVEKAPQQPFKLPVSAISSLMTYFPGQISSIAPMCAARLRCSGLAACYVFAIAARLSALGRSRRLLCRPVNKSIFWDFRNSAVSRPHCATWCIKHPAPPE